MAHLNEKKNPPNNTFAEKVILGHILLNPNSSIFIFDKLPLDAFYSEIYKIIYKTIYSLYSQNKPINFITISDELTSLNLLEFIGGDEILFDISNQDIILEDLEKYLSLVLDKYLRRTIFIECNKLCKIAYNQAYSIDFLVEHNQKVLSAFSSNRNKIGLLTTSEVLLETFIHLEKKTKQGESSGIQTGFFGLDQLTGGLQKGDLIILAGRPSMGKTAFALNLAKNMSELQNFPIVIFSLEMSRQQLIYRFLASEAQISSTKLQSGKINSKNWYSINKSIYYLSNLRIYLDDTLTNSLKDIKLKLLKLKSKSKQIGAIIIDYLQLLTENSSKETRSQELSKITRNLKIISKELNAPIIVLSQLSRNLESRYNKKPMLSDLRESGCLSGNNNLYSIKNDTFTNIKFTYCSQTKHEILSKTINSLCVTKNYCKKIIITGYKHLFKVKTFGTYEIKLTAEHKIFTLNGWIKTKMLKKKDCIAVIDKYNFSKIFIKAINQIIFSDTIFCLIHSVNYKLSSFVYDLWFPYTKNFVCNNIFVHNSIEQDADVVLMLYRENYYHPSTKNENVSELIIAKQRNGPIGNIKLIFDPKIVTFSNMLSII